jgi:hypothetical protein
MVLIKTKSLLLLIHDDKRKKKSFRTEKKNKEEVVNKGIKFHLILLIIDLIVGYDKNRLSYF